MVVLDEKFSENEDEDKLRGIKDINLLKSAIEEPKQTFDKKDLYNGILEKASCYLRSIAMDHAFYNGNKRTALLATIMFLEENGYEVIASNEKMYKLTEQVVTRQFKILSIKKRLKKFVREVPRARKPGLREIIDSTLKRLKRR